MVTDKPVTGKITGYRFQFSITGYRFTNIFSSRNAVFGFSFVSHTHRQTKTGLNWTQTIPAPCDGSVPLVQLYPVFDCRVCSSPLPAQPGKVGGKRCELDGRRGWHRLKPRVITACHFFWSNHCCIHGRARWFNWTATWADFPGLLLLFSVFTRAAVSPKLTPFECRHILCFNYTAQIVRYTNWLTTPVWKSLWCRPNKRRSVHCSAF